MRIISLMMAGLAGALLLSALAPESGAGQDGCGSAGSWTEFRAKVATVFPTAKSHDVTGEAKARIVAYYNATPPATAFEPDSVRYLTRPNTSVALIVLEKGGCVVATAQIPVDLLRTILGARVSGIEI